MFLNEVQRHCKVGFDFSFFLALEEFRAGRHQRLHYAHAVGTGAAACLGNLLFGLRTVFAFREYQMEVKVAAGGVNIGIAGVLLLSALVVGLNVTDLRSLVLGKAKNGILCFHRLSLRFCHMMSYRWRTDRQR